MAWQIKPLTDLNGLVVTELTKQRRVSTRMAGIGVLLRGSPRHHQCNFLQTPSISTRVLLVAEHLRTRKTATSVVAIGTV